MGFRWRRTEPARTEREDTREREQGLAREALEAARSAVAVVSAEYDALLDRCGAAAIVLDNNGVVVRTNATAERLLGVRGISLVGRSLLTATLSDELDALFKTARDHGEATRQEARAPTGGGRIVEVEITRIGGGVGAQTRYLLVAHDVTERRRLENMRRDFVANVSHELRTPLASIRALAETLRDGALTDPTVADSFLGTIVAETERLARIAEDLLVLSDAESHQPQKEALDLSELAEFVIGRCRPQAARAGITLTADIEAGLFAHASRDQIEQVLVNLVDNAIKYTGEGGTIHAQALREDGRVAVRVTDTGIGIMSQDLPRIFERFYRVDKARSRQSGGTGLGLSIVKHIVESHGGTVTVQSEFNRGSTFVFTLPVGERE